MMNAIGKMGWLVVAGIAVYVSVLIAQNQAAAELCDSYPVGSRIEDLANLSGTFFLTRMGPITDPTNPAVQKVIFCASMAMCDTSCSLELEDRVVTSARFLDF